MSSWGNRSIQKRRIIIPNVASPNTSNNLKKSEETIIHTYNSDIAFKDTFTETNTRINNFKNINNDSLITFIIPSINRDTLLRTLLSIKNQKIQNFKVIVIFDGCEPEDEEIITFFKNNNRFLYISINKQGLLKDKIHGAAGFVRNIAMSLVTTPWIGFVDDDDTLKLNYIEKLNEEIKITPNADLISFRMLDDGKIIPPIYETNIVYGSIGISFCFKSQLFKDGFKFRQTEQEDYDLINDIKNAKKKIVISPYLTYCVRSDNKIFTDSLICRRVIIN